MYSNIKIKTPKEIEKMRVAGKLAAQLLVMIEKYVKPGVTTNELNEICHNYIIDKQHAIPAPLNYQPSGYKKPFPKSICTSVNDEICHGIPSDRILITGDIVNVDVTIIKDGYHGDTSKTFFVGNPSKSEKDQQALRLIKIAQECLYSAIKPLKSGIKSNIIGQKIQEIAQKAGFSVVREYCGHGIGQAFHEEPHVLHYKNYNPLNDFILKEGMIFTIEPMINFGSRETKLAADGWTVVTKDHSLSAQWEHTILITKNNAEVLTLRPNETIM